MDILIYFFIAISLSIDAFSLALSLGTSSPPKNKSIKLILTIGIFHFIMPQLGSLVGLALFPNTNLLTKIIPIIIFTILAISLYFNKLEDNIPILFNWFSILIIAFTVSIDSFSVGIALGISKESIIKASTIIALTSSLATFSGLYIGNYMNKIYQERAKYLGIILLFILIIKYIFKPI